MKLKKRRRQTLRDKRAYQAWDAAIVERDRELRLAAPLKPSGGVMVGTAETRGMFEVVITIYFPRKRHPITIVVMSDGR